VQIVVCPGLNDGVHLARTVSDLAALHPAVASIGVVPVGLTKHAPSAFLPASKQMARGVVEAVSGWQEGFRRRLGTRLVFAADEMYLLAGLPFPSRAHYEGFPQLGNGIGCARLFADRVRRLKPPRLRHRVSVCLVTGEMAAPLVAQLAARLMNRHVEPRVCVVRNRLFGRTVTTAGLLAGRDIAQALGGQVESDFVIVPGTAIREGEGFIDGMTLEQLSARIGRPVIAASTPAEVTAALRRFDRGKRRR